MPQMVLFGKGQNGFEFEIQKIVYVRLGLALWLNSTVPDKTEQHSVSVLPVKEDNLVPWLACCCCCCCCCKLLLAKRQRRSPRQTELAPISYEKKGATSQWRSVTGSLGSMNTMNIIIWESFTSFTIFTLHRVPHPKTPLYDLMIKWLNDNMILWLHEYIILWLHDHMIKWLHDNMILWLHEYIILWLHDHMINPFSGQALEVLPSGTPYQPSMQCLYTTRWGSSS